MNEELANYRYDVDELDTIKVLDTESLVRYLEKFSGRYKNSDEIVDALNSLFRKKGFNLNSTSEEILFISSLALVLASIGMSYSPAIRNKNLKKVNDICEKQGINNEMLRALTTSEENIISILKSGRI